MKGIFLKFSRKFCLTTRQPCRQRFRTSYSSARYHPSTTRKRANGAGGWHDELLPRALQRFVRVRLARDQAARAARSRPAPVPRRRGPVLAVSGRRLPAQRPLPRHAAPARQRTGRDHLPPHGDRAALRTTDADERPRAARAHQLFAVAHRPAGRRRRRLAQAPGRGGRSARRPGTGHRRLQDAERDRRRPRRRASRLFHRLLVRTRSPDSSSWTWSRARSSSSSGSSSCTRTPRGPSPSATARRAIRR